jgi:Pregnancy-associated plasma protein-A
LRHRVVSWRASIRHSCETTISGYTTCLFGAKSCETRYSDTPTQLGPNFGTPTFPSISCNNGPNGDMFMNYMDYVDDETMVIFTAQQVLRMRTALAQERPNLGRVQSAAGGGVA